MFPVVQKSLTNLNSYQSCLVLFFLAFFAVLQAWWNIWGRLGFVSTNFGSIKVFRRKFQGAHMDAFSSKINDIVPNRTFVTLFGGI